MGSPSEADINRVWEQNSRLCDQLLKERERRQAAEDAKYRLLDENEELWRQVRDLKQRLEQFGAPL